MNRLLIILLLALSTVVSAQINYQLAGEAYAIHNLPDCSVREYLKGPKGVFDPKTETWRDTCWVGTPGFNFVETVGAEFSDRASIGIRKALESQMNRENPLTGGLSYTLPGGEKGFLVKSQSPVSNQASIDWLMESIIEDYRNTEVEGVFKWPSKTK